MSKCVLTRKSQDVSNASLLHHYLVYVNVNKEKVHIKYFIRKNSKNLLTNIK